MIDQLTLEACKNDRSILDLKINNLEFAIKQSEKIINESTIDMNTLKFLRKKLAHSTIELETLYLIRNQNHSDL
tara:strand:+ start:1567 stop:1788 length:222 start_codon:yes stop_codon:yes gene_type:complete